MTTRPRGKRRALAAAGAALALAAIAAPALATGDYGKDTCLNGYVWREAVPTDHVCVTPMVRMQTAQENDDAAVHRSPTGGAYGPNTCVNGYVWRAAVASDLVCVAPPQRRQARDDNAQAAARRDSLHVWLTYYRSDDAQRYRVRADHLNVGTATVLLRRTDTGAQKTWRAAVGQNPNAPGGLLVFASGMLRCSGPANAYFAVRDPVSLRWSARVPVRTGCATY